MTDIERYDIALIVEYLVKRNSEKQIREYLMNYALNNPEHKLWDYFGLQGGTIHQIAKRIIELKRNLRYV